MSWSHIDKLLERLNRISTVFGKYWISTLIILRLLLLSAFGRGIWSEESKDFSCNTKQPGCTNVCFNAFTPVSHVRLWELQVLAVSLPIIAFMVYIGYLDDKAKTKKKDKDSGKKTTSKVEDISVFGGGDPDKHRKRWNRLKSYVVDENKQSKVDTRKIWKMYVLQCTVRTLVDIAFVFVQLNTYVYKWEVPIVYLCSLWPCPHTVDCFISRPKEKSLFLQYMFISAGISVVLGIFEIIHILTVYSRKKKAKTKQSKERESPRYVSTPTKIPPSYSGTPNGMRSGRVFAELTSLPLPKHILAGAAGAAVGGALATSFPFPADNRMPLPRRGEAHLSFSDESNFGEKGPNPGDSDDSRINPHRTRRRRSQIENLSDNEDNNAEEPSAPPAPPRSAEVEDDMGEETEPEEEEEEEEEDEDEEEAGGGGDDDD